VTGGAYRPIADTFCSDPNTEAEAVTEIVTIHGFQVSGFRGESMSRKTGCRVSGVGEDTMSRNRNDPGHTAPPAYASLPLLFRIE